MAFLRASGAEVSVDTSTGAPDVHTLTGTVTRDTTVGIPVSGAAAWKMDSTGANTASYNELDIGLGLSGGTTTYARLWMRFEALPDSTVIVFQHGSPASTTNGVAIKLTSAGKFQFWNLVANTQIGSDSSITVSTGVYYCLEFGNAQAGGASLDAAEARIDGVTLGSVSGLGGLLCNAAFPFGWREAPGASKVCYADDFICYDSTGSFNNTWVGSNPKVLWMKPGSDSQVGSWTGGAGGTTNLFDAVNNTPPIGTAAETNLTQIESIDSSGNNATDEYRGDCGSYTAAGVGASDTVNGISAWCNHGEDVNTNTKTGSFGMQANPSGTYQTFTFGGDAGALGTYPSNWQWSGGASGTTIDNPSVTLASSAIIACRKTDAGTRVASIDALGFYIAYTPAEVITPTAIRRGVEPPEFLRRRRLPRRALNFAGEIAPEVVAVPRNPAINHQNPGVL